MSHALSPSMEMYLKTILGLGGADRPVRVTEIAQEMEVKLPSVSEALHALRARKLVVHSSYGTVRLSTRGRQAATAVQRRYEILRRFFTDVLGVDRPTAERDACEIEHVVGEDTLARLTAFLEYVTCCRRDVAGVVEHFQEFAGLRLAGERCPECGGSSEGSAGPRTSLGGGRA